MHWALSLGDANQLVEDLRAGKSRKAELLKVAGEGPDNREAVAAAMATFRDEAETLITKRARDAGAPRGSSDSQDATKDGIEGRLSVSLFRSLRDLGPDVLTDPGFWRYLAVWEMFDFIQWRDGATCKLVSFGAESHSPTWDCVPKRMFVRARIAEEARGSEQADALASIAGTDVWRSHVLRVKTGNAPLLAAALMEAWERKDIRTDEVREVAKSIKRLRSNLVFELLDEGQVEEVMSRQIARSLETK